jgi:hypothetical protein
LKQIKEILQGLHEISLSPPVFSFLLASSPVFSTPYEAASQGSSSNKKMTKGISTRRWALFFLRGKWSDLDRGTSSLHELKTRRAAPPPSVLFDGGEAQGQHTGEGAEAAQGKNDQEKVCIDTSFSKETLIHLTHQNKWATLNPFDHRIKYVSIKTDVFWWDLCIGGLRSSIGAMVKKFKIWSTPKPLYNET